MITLTETQKNLIWEDSSELWFSGLFSSISARFKEATFEEKKETFFLLVSEWLDKELIKFVRLDGKQINGSYIWDESNEVILRYLKDNFPKEATNENDFSVNDYFYFTAPPILWLEEDGTYMGS